MIQKFVYNNNEFRYILYDDFKNEYTNLLPYEIQNIKQAKYINIGCAFDIETSRIDEHHSVMYVWQFALGNITIIGRKWCDFVDLLDLISNELELNPNKRLLCFVHNLSYEWQFIRKHLEYEYDKRHEKFKVFAMEERKIVYFSTSNYIEFRDSLILTQRPLEKLTSAYNLDIKKLTESNFNYDLIRHNKTPLSNNELAYCINDVQVLVNFFNKYCKKEFLAKQLKLPLTSTGIVRDDLRRTFKKLPTKERKQWKSTLERAQPTEQEYKALFRWVFRGGFVHANASIADETLVNCFMGSQDFKSSYPAVMLHNIFPIIFCKKSPKFFEQIKNDREYMEYHAFYGTFKIKKIRAKYTHSIESISKIYKCDEKSLLVDNGRLVACDWIIVALTEQDYLNYCDFYEFDEIECISQHLHVSYKEELPKFVKDMILKYYATKESMPKDSLDYKLAKASLNSIYGMTVTNIINKSLKYDDDKIQLDDNEQSYDRLIKKEILVCYIGIWVTAYARRNLLHYGFLPFCKSDTNDICALYGDTDSIKYKNIFANQYIFDNYNDRMRRINKNMYVGEYDRKLFENLGCFDFEHKYYKFKTLGGKRYIYSQSEYNKDDNKYRLEDFVTVAGCRKGSLQDYCRNNDLDIYETFTNDLELNSEESKKLTTHYNDEPFTINVTDYLGNVAMCSELSCVTLNKIPFTMTMKDDYLRLIYQLKNKNERVIGVRVWT